MVLYCMQHSGSIIRSIVHKLKYHPQDDAVFFVDEDISSQHCPHIDKIKYYQMPDPFEIVRHSSRSKEETKKYTNEIIYDFFRGIGLDPLQFSHIYVLFDEYNPFILYFEMNSIRYISVETTDNSFFNYASGKSISQLMSMHPEAYAYNCLIRDMHLQDAYGENCVKAYLYSDRSVYEPLPGKADAAVFGFHEALISLDEKYKRQITADYDAGQYNFDTALLFSSPSFTKGSFAIYKLEMPSGYMEDDEFGGVCYFYKTLIDYYFNDVDFAIKLHPKSDENFVRYFSGFKQLPAEAPIELLLLLDKQFDAVCPDLGIDCDFFQNHKINVTVFGGAIFEFFRYIHFIFLTFTIINAIGLPEKITVSGIDLSQMEHFKSWAYKGFEDVEFEQLHWHNVWDANFIIAAPSADFAEIIKKVPDDCLIFVYGACQTDSITFAEQKMMCSLNDASDGKELQSFSWTVLSKNQELIDNVKDFSASYTLENANITVQSQPFSDLTGE